MKTVASLSFRRNLLRFLRQFSFHKESFGRNVMTLTMGTTLAEGLIVVATPILTRLYTTEDFGVWGLFVALTWVFSAVASLRYELAIMLPERDEEAMSLLILSLLIAALISCLAFFVLFFFRSQLALTLGIQHFALWTWSVPISLFSLGMYQACAFWSTRKKQFVRLTLARVSQSMVSVSIQICAGWLMASGASGLIGGRIAGQVAAAGVVGIQIWKQDRNLLRRSFCWPSLVRHLIRFRNFPLYAAPYSFIGAFFKQVLYVLLATYASTSAVGFFTLARKFTYMPISLISSSMNQVFFQKMAIEAKSGDLAYFVLRMLNILVIVATPVLVSFLFNARWLFGAVFGSEWITAGTYAACLAPPAFMLLLTSWLDRVYDVKGKQKLSLVLEVIYNFFSIGLFFIGMSYFGDAIWAIAAYSAITVVYNVIWLLITFRIAQLPLKGLWKIARNFLILLSVTSALQYAMQFL